MYNLLKSYDTKHRVFISFYHGEKDGNNDGDMKYKIEFENKFKDLFINESVMDGEYDPDLSTDYIKHLIATNNVSLSTVVVVLIGPKTYQRKHVDWEIYAGLSERNNKTRAGLIGILLPEYSNAIENRLYSKYNESTIPERLLDNIKTGYADIYEWDDIISKNYKNEYRIKAYIKNAFNKRLDRQKESKNDRSQMERNKRDI